ncbi:MAG: GNAT family N-acetyltransferase, partial [Flammeovirgaceae bacterium]
VKISENEIEIPALGVAGLCTSPSAQRSGVGKSLLTYFMNQCKLNKVVGILFCKEKVKKFYQNNGWTTYPVKVNGNFFNHYFMVYNFSGNIQSTFEFQGELF